MDEIMRMARANADREFVGILASPPDEIVVTGIDFLQATASSAHAEAKPEAVKEGVDRLLSDGLIPKGLVHSHGSNNVFHSSRDIQTIKRLLPAMAASSYRSPPPSNLAPVVTGPDSVEIPTPVGKKLKITLMGPAIPDLDAHERAEWASVVTGFGASGDPQALTDGQTLTLRGDAVEIKLGIPEGGGLTLRTEESYSVQFAQVYSLVVNSSAAYCAQCTTVYEITGECLLKHRDCEIQIVGKKETNENTKAVFHPESAIGKQRYRSPRSGLLPQTILQKVKKCFVSNGN